MTGAARMPRRASGRSWSATSGQADLACRNHTSVRPGASAIGIAWQGRAAGQLLGASSRDVALVAITLSPRHRSAAVIGAFNRREQLNTVPNWLFLTGSLPQLQRVWQAYSVTAAGLAVGAVAGHTGQAYVIDRAGHVRQVLNTDAGPGTAATRASFASLLAGAAQQALRSP